MTLSDRIATLKLEEGRILRRKPEIEQERQQALDDLLRENEFAPVGMGEGPYHLTLGVSENRLLFKVTSEAEPKEQLITLALTTFRAIIRDYFLICESYFQAIKASDPYKIEAIDMGRRGIHNEGSDLLRKLLADKVKVDFSTARRLFTLICVLHIR